jgi:alkylation response protein AidB-like acyl-CoA dehydrogenase
LICEDHVVSARDAALARLGEERAAALLPEPPDRPLDRASLLQVFAGLRDTGFLGSTLPPELGGAGLSHSAFGSLVEGVGGGLPFLSNHSVQRYLHASGSDGVCARWLTPLLDGRAIGLVAITEPHGGSQVADVRTEVRRTADGLRLYGAKTWLVHATVAHVAVVLARGPDGAPVRVVVDLDGPGVRRTPMPTSGLRYLPFGSLEFDGCPVPDDAVLAGDGVAATKTGFAVARSLVGVQAVALAQRALTRTVYQLADRTARDRPVTSSDVVRHRVGAMAGRIEAARLLCYEALTGVDDARPGCDALAAAAKVLATDVARDVTTECVELCAGAGAAANSVAARCRDDAALLATADGTSLVNQTIWGGHVVRELLRERPDLWQGPEA